MVSPVSEPGSIAGRRILVTGATGFIGQHLVDRLIADRAEVTILLRDQDGAIEKLPSTLRVLRPRLKLVLADLRNNGMTARAVREAAPQQVIHLAAAGVTDPFLSVNDALRHNVYGTLNLARACFDNRLLPRPVEKMVVARTPGERTAMNVYSASKSAAWQFCQMYGRTAGWPLVGAMVFQAYGPGQSERALVPSAIRAALTSEPFPMTSGRQERDWIFVKDVVDGLAATLRVDLSPGTSVELGTGIATSVRDVAQLIFRLADSRSQPASGQLQERPGEEKLQVASVELTRKLLSWSPEVPLVYGLQRTIAWLSAAGLD